MRHASKHTSPTHWWHDVRLAAQVLAWRATWNRYDLDQRPDGLPEVFVSARAAAALIPDGATVMSCGMAAHHRASLMFWAIRDRFEATGSPHDLTWCAVGGAGGRGLIPGTLEELGRPGLVTKALLGHVETVRSFLRLADAGELELHTIPQGQFALLLESQANGGPLTRESEVGVGSFLDPRVGRGSCVSDVATEQFVGRNGDQLVYRMPRLDVAVVVAPWADRAGNLLRTDAACLTEIYDLARAVHANGGTVIAIVAGVAPDDPQAVYVRSEWVDAIVVHPEVDQTGAVQQRHAWHALSTTGTDDPEQAVADARLVNRLMGVTPRRTAADAALARLGASVAAAHLKSGSVINIGVGLPEEVGRLLGEEGFNTVVHQTTETGVFGGTPLPGAFFGAAVNPREQLRSAEMFHRYRHGVDLTCLGFLELDGAGRVNSSRRGDRPTEAVGPGGLPDIAHYASLVLFVGRFALGERLEVGDGRLTVAEPGVCRFVDTVREVTFDGALARARGQQVVVATHRALLRLGADGWVVEAVMPGIRVQEDVIDPAGGAIALPPGGVDAVEVLSRQIVDGDGFVLPLP